MLYQQNEIKRLLGEKSAALVEAGMLVGLGTGTTASYFIESLIKRCKKGLKIQAVASSIQSLNMANEGGIPIYDMDKVTSIDLTVDGADEIAPSNDLIKGRGGALVREKILASSSKRLVIIVDDSKLVNVLGKAHLPVEIIPFGYTATINKLNKMGYEGKLRKKDQSSFYVTDNGNYIFDIDSPIEFINPEEDHKKLISIPGVVDTGFFFNLVSDVLVGYRDGRVLFRK
jgi:ribose 5-phosphate isomerase A